VACVVHFRTITGDKEMKYLSHYLEAAQTAAFKKHGAFFAFSNKQFDEKKKAGVTYVRMGAGLLCPKDNAAKLDAKLDAVYKEGVAADVAENGIDAIISRELANHECYYSGDWTDAAEALDAYGVTEEQLRAAWVPYTERCAASW